MELTVSVANLSEIDRHIDVLRSIEENCKLTLYQSQIMIDTIGVFEGIKKSFELKTGRQHD